MKFRQRIAWLLLLLYLMVTLVAVYYIFEISEQFNSLALKHVQDYHDVDVDKSDKLKDRAGLHKKESDSSKGHSSMWTHLTDVPMAVWIAACLIPYLQIFFVILTCTKSEPKLSVTLLWPVYIYLGLRETLCGERGLGVSKAVNSPVSNGHILVDT
ncbi:transmembrane protein 251-B-like [Lingula anatina]|uniref:Lysosomal enzyme trafficking factor n=1 Tax=Lingula anatina TaxID=7574 RepID=A0A1S3J5M2_LINAN|nr:transmembrane protein 251-B-like [Lingula anatina]|eukprot:XP_013405722.1 transmembrane protein 251-B-like [Lingula anatina]